MFIFDFIVTLEISTTISDALASTPTMLQSIMFDFGSTNSIIDHTVKALTSLRTDMSWEKLQENVVKLRSQYGTEKEEQYMPRKKRFLDEYSLDDYQPNNKTNLQKVNVHYPMIDFLLMQIEERFVEETPKILKNMGTFCQEHL